MAKKSKAAIEIKSKSQPSGWRNSAATILIIFGSLLIPFTVAAIWLHNTILDTNTYVSTVAPLSFNQDIDNDLATAITNRLFQKVDVSSQISNALPEQGQFLVQPLTERTQNFTQEQISRALGTEQFNKLWVEANRISQPQIAKLLTGGGEIIQATNGQVTLDLGPIIDQAKNRLSDAGINIFNNVSFGLEDRQFIIFQSERLAQAQSFISLLNQLVFILPLLVLIFIGAAIIISTNRFRTFFHLGVGFSLAGLALLLTILLVRNWYVGLGNKILSTPAAATAFFDTMTRFLQSASWVILIIGLILIAVVYLLKYQFWQRD